MAKIALGSLKGASAYELAVEAGFVGSEAQWLASLEGPVGDVTPAATAAKNAAETAATAAVNAKNAAETAAASVPSEAELSATIDAAVAGKASTGAVTGVSVDSLRLDNLATLANADRNRSIASSRIAYEDGATFIETWANLSNWTLDASPGMQVSAGGLYSANNNGANGGANHAWDLGTTGLGRAVITFNKVNGGTNSGKLIIGVSKDAVGAAPASGAVNARGLVIRPSSPVQRWTDGVAVDHVEGTSAGLGTVVIVADANYLSITIMNAAGTIESREKWARAGFSINNLFIFNSTADQLTASSVRIMGSKTAIATVAPRAGIEGVNPTVQWTAVGNAGIRVALPKNYDSRKPSPVLLAFHGNGANETYFGDHVSGQAVQTAFLNAGYIVVSAANTPNVSTWGAQAGVDAYYEAYKLVRDTYAIGPVVLYAVSMGGIESLLTLAERRIPGIAAWIGQVPTANLAANYANATFTATIKTAYGIASDGSDYVAKTAGRDPMLKAGSAFRGVPMWAMVATDDTAVFPAENWDVFAPIVQPYAAEFVRVNVTGGHGASVTGQLAAMVAFANKYTAA